ncbi:kinase-like domain-containing protein [Mucor mucedo]|uniref:kinase-like domain-containing protein n=1 Tax=Mucor mucedo TaxID=29922 RepID=UPI002220B7E9|nr:kinase-like domain-containing protein [Mucor mucedo]KAI7879846.1 kinase-like domain-containing protein [Mucor mucedo]
MSTLHNNMTQHISIHPLATNSGFIPSLPTTTKNVELTVSAKLLMNHNLNKDFTAKYVLGQELGSGGFGFVVSAHERATGIERAVKFIIRKKVPSNAWVCDPNMGMIPMEIYTLKHVHHQNIIHYCDSYQDDTYFYLVMELHGTQWVPPPTFNSIHSPALSQNSQSTIDEDELVEPVSQRQFVRRTSCDLFECIEQHKHFEEALAKKIFKQIASCVAYLESIGVCHRDIKDENIVIDQDYKVKLIDFGSSVLLHRHSSSSPKKFTRFYGTLSFASPEILLSNPYRAEPAEIWSLGVLLFTLLFGEIPFPDSKSAIEGHILKPKIRVSSHCQHLISCLLQKNPDDRLNIHQVLNHPWLKE